MTRSTALRNPCCADACQLHAWRRLPADIHHAIATLPTTTEKCFRTDILCWLYQEKGQMSFVKIASRITGYPEKGQAKRQVSNYLRSLCQSGMVSIGNATGGPAARADGKCRIGKHTLIGLTELGMRWLERGWGARLRVLRHSSDGEAFSNTHRLLSEEEDEGKANDPYWIEDLRRTASAPYGHTAMAGRPSARLTSVWDLAAVPWKPAADSFLR